MNPQEFILSSHNEAMRVFRTLAIAGCLAFCFLSFAQKQAWVPVTAAELEMKEVLGNQGAIAIQLYYSQNIDDYDMGDESEYGEFIYRRIKVLNKQGEKYADVEIRVLPGFKLANLKARTIHPDGKIIDFTGK